VSSQSFSTLLDSRDFKGAFVEAVQFSMLSEVVPVFEAFSQMVDGMGDTLIQNEPSRALHLADLKTLMVG